MKVVGDVIVKVTTPLLLVPFAISAVRQAPATIVIDVSDYDLNRTLRSELSQFIPFGPLGTELAGTTSPIA